MKVFFFIECVFATSCCARVISTWILIQLKIVSAISERKGNYYFSRKAATLVVAAFFFSLRYPK